MKLLVVDDNALLREQMAKYLRRKDHNVTTVADGVQALQTLSRQNIDVCITDYQMTGMNGLDLILAIGREYPATRVLLMTGSGIELAARALSRGAYQVFHKPFRMEKIMKALERIEADGRLEGASSLAA